MIKLVLIIVICATALNVTGIKIDNQLIAANNDCFTKILYESMLRPEIIFRRSDTNSEKVCQELCLAEGSACQSLSFGISAKGNGTCLLSSERIDATLSNNPYGTIYEPDFDIYEKRMNCGIDEPNLARPNFENNPSSPSASSFPPSSSASTGGGGNTRPLPTTIFTTTNGIPITTSGQMRPSSSMPTDATTYIDDGGGGGGDHTNYPNDNRYSPSIPNQPQTPYGGTTTSETTNRYPNGQQPYPSTPQQRPSPTDKYPDRNQYGNSNNYPIDNNKYGTTRPTQLYPYTPINQDKFNFYTNPTYSYPMLYEKNYPMPNDNNNQFPNMYAQNIPSIDTNYYRPTAPPLTYGMGNNNKYGSNSDPNNYYYRPSDRPNNNGYSTSQTTMPNNDNNGYNTNFNTPNKYANNNNNNNNNMGGGNNYGTATTIDSTRPTDSYKPVQENTGYGGSNNVVPGNTGGPYKPPNSYRPSNNGQNVYQGQNQEGNYHVTAEPIETYFNPDDYYLKNPKSCFRRVLAGKRVSHLWVRRTLTCERVEDCQKECGIEKRFTCEGFNYRLDPSGRGQGICELIEVPLSEMDLYSSPNNRDENLLYHPDYDYYERDRNACRPSACSNCQKYKPSYSGGGGSSSSGGGGGGGDAIDYYRPTTYKPVIDNYRPHSTAIDKYRPPTVIYESRPPQPSSYNSRPPPAIYEERPTIYESRPPDYDRYDVSNHPYSTSGEHFFRPISYGGSSGGGGGGGGSSSGGASNVDRYDVIKYRPPYHEISKPSINNVYQYPNDRPDPPYIEEIHRPHIRPLPNDNEYNGPYRPEYQSPYSSATRPEPRPDRYSNRDSTKYEKPFVPYAIGQDNTWGSYGGSYGGSTFSKYSSDYWGLQNNDNRKHGGSQFNYQELSGPKYNRYGNENKYSTDRNYDKQDNYAYRDKNYYDSIGSAWTRRPGEDECSAKSSEGFKLHKGIIKYAYTVPTVTECEKMCHSESKFHCYTYSYRYVNSANENCQLCDRPVHLLDYYADIEPDRDYDIYSMSDDVQMCSKPKSPDHKNNAQCFFRAIETSRFFKSIVRDSLSVRSIGECEMECIKSSKFTCRAFSYRYGSKTIGSIIDNCQLSDWPVRDMDKERHLVLDVAFDIYERASYGHGCEIQPIIDEKHQKLCYLGYGSPAKLLSSAIKKVISVPTELECKNECIRFRENTSFKCYSFSFASQASSFNCEMSDLDQSELKPNIHYSHSNDRDYWLFAWNPFDWTCRDKITSVGIGGSNRVNNDRRMDIFREPGENTWSQFTVSGKACRIGSGCQKNIITSFYSCEIEGGEIASWDYCCKSDHPCGYSQGFDYPWCFVGDDLDQWRTCSDRYFPPNKNHLSLSSSSSSSPSVITYTAINNNNVNKKKGSLYQQAPPRPGGLQSVEDVGAARLWPITYLYNSGPPNSTELSNFVDCNHEIC